MISNDYRIEYYRNSQTNQEPVKDYINDLDEETQGKIHARIELLRENKGRLCFSYTSHITGKIWELRVDFGKSHHRIFYFVCVGKRIVLLHAFLKKTKKIPPGEKEKAINNYKDFISNN